MIKSITLLGSSSGRNAGDAALISGIMDGIDERIGSRLRYEIPTIKPEFIRTGYANDVVPISMLPWALSVKMLGIPTFRSIMRTDLTLIFDAILFDRSLFNPLFNFLSTLRILLPVAKRNGKKLGMFNVGAGPVTTPLGKRMLKDVCNMMDFITVRDNDSLQILTDIGVSSKNVQVTADAALNLKPSSGQRGKELIENAGLNPEAGILGINISAYLDSWVGPEHTPMGKEHFLKTLAAALSRFSDLTGAQFLFVCTQHHDVSVTRELMSLCRVPVKGIISNRWCSHYDIKAVLGAISLLFGMRLHATILAASALTPVSALPHQPKVRHFFKTLDLENYVFDYKNFTEEGLVAHLLKSWESRPDIRNRLRAAVPEQQKKAMIAAEIVASM